jgi:predicted PurR-regulated permease PerM
MSRIKSKVLPSSGYRPCLRAGLCTVDDQWPVLQNFLHPSDALGHSLFGIAEGYPQEAFRLAPERDSGNGDHVPILYATILAILFNPLVNFLVSKRINRTVAISVAVTFAILVFVIFIYVVSSRLALFSESYPQLKQKFTSTSIELVRWISETFNVRRTKINLWVTESQSEAINDVAIGESLSEVARVLISTMLLPVYLFMILYYKPLLLEFIRKLFPTEHHMAVVQVLTNSKQIIQTYLVGLSFELVIMAILHSVGLLLLGIEYAIILGIIGAFLNIIPYIGGIVATALAMVIAFVTKDALIYPILVLVLYLVIQFIDNNYIVPKIVAARVQLNALVSIIVVLIGGALWGISGMFLSIPLTAILKVIFDHIESLKPWGYLLGNIVPTTSRFSFAVKQKNVVIQTNSTSSTQQNYE